MKISVLIPAFNREKYIEYAINSIINQTYKDIEIVVYDDGSNDSTANIVSQMAKLDNRITLIKGELNKGESFARNQLLNYCKTEIACWQDSDDISLPNRIETQAKEIEYCDYVFCGWAWYDLKKPGIWAKRKRAVNHLASPTLMFRVNKKIKFNNSMKISGTDWDYLSRLNIEKLIEIREVLYLLRSHDDRMGVLKTKIRNKFTEKEINNMSYAQLRDAVK